MKTILSWLANGISLAIILPFYLLYLLLWILLSREHAFQGMSQFFSLFPGLIGNYLRRAFYVLSLKRCSWNCCISFGTVFSSPLAEIGSAVYIGSYVTLGDVTLADDVMLGSNVDIINGTKQHYIENITVPIREQGGEYPKVFIGEDTWIGNGALVMCSIGKKCVVGAQSVVTKPIDDYLVVIGNPAKILKKRI